MLALLLVLIVGYGAIAEDLDSLLERSRYSVEEREEFAELFADSEAAGIPNELLTLRLAEGIAKRVPAARVRAVLQGEIAQLLTARTLLLEAEAELLLVDPSTWARAANLLDAGITPESVERLARGSADRLEAFRPASMLLVSLVEWGLEEPQAAELCASIASSLIHPEEFPVILDVLIEGRLNRVGPEEMAQRILEVLPDVQSARELHRSVL